MDPLQQDGRDEALIARAVAGDRAAFETLVSPYLPRLQAFVARRLSARAQGKESAVDIVQSTCREVLADLSAFDSHGEGEAAFKNWVFKTALRKLHDRGRYYRRQKRDPGREVRRTGDPLLDLARSTGTPSRVAIGKETRAQVRRALDTLPDHYREVVELLFFRGLSAEQAGKLLGKSRTATHSLLARALARLARVMESKPV